MSKALFSVCPCTAMQSSLPLVRELADRGEESLFQRRLCRRSNRRARPKTYRNAFLRDMKAFRTGWKSFHSTLERRPDVLERELSEIRAESPDYLIHDSVAPWANASRSSASRNHSMPTFAFNRHVLAFGLGRGLRRRVCPVGEQAAPSARACRFGGKSAAHHLAVCA